MRNLSENLNSVFEKLKNPERGIETGFYQLDDMLLGFKPSELIVVAGRPSMGKTSLMTDFILHASKTKPVAVFSAEMSFQILAERVIVSSANLNLHSLKRGGINQKTQAAVEKTIVSLQQNQVYIDDTSYLTPLSIRNTLKQMQTSCVFEMGCVFIDYLQLLGADMSTGRSYEDMGNITRDLKVMAKEMNLPVVLLCQLNRQPANRESHEPRLSDLRDSGKIEENSDVVLLIHRPSYFNTKEIDLESEDDGEAFIMVAKNRNGPVGKVPVVWLSERMSFRDIKPEIF